MCVHVTSLDNADMGRECTHIRTHPSLCMRGTEASFVKVQSPPPPPGLSLWDCTVVVDGARGVAIGTGCRQLSNCANGGKLCNVFVWAVRAFSSCELANMLVALAHMCVW